MIRTSAEHPFFVVGRGWQPCNELKVGDQLLCADGTWAAVEDLLDTGEWEAVYNLRVADFHTYFVGCDEWGFSVWAHNAEYVVLDHPTVKGAKALAEKQADGSFIWIEKNWTEGHGVRQFATEADAITAVKSGDGEIITGTAPNASSVKTYNGMHGYFEAPKLEVPSGHQAPKLGDRVGGAPDYGTGFQGGVVKKLDEPGTVVKVFKSSEPAWTAGTEVERLMKLKKLSRDNVVEARAMIDRKNASQNWLVKEEVTMLPPPTTAAANTEKVRLATLFEQAGHEDALHNLRWGTTAGNSTPRWILIE